MRKRSWAGNGIPKGEEGAHGYCKGWFVKLPSSVALSRISTMSLASWYQQQYSVWSRFRRPPQPSSDPAMATTPTQPNNPADPNSPNTPAATQNQKKVFEPLFGPALGVVTQGPSWTISTEKKVVTDDLTPEVVSSWVEKSKEPSQPTTTLQALVNLKRPTLRLSPLTSSDEDPSHEHHHGLEFEYDCDAPKCGIYLHVFIPKDHPDAPATHYPLAKLLVFETVVEGGFGRTLKLEEGAVLELGRWEYVAGRAASPATPEASGLPTVPEAMSPSSSGDGSRPSTGTGNNNTNSNHRRRFTHFHFRKRSQNRSVSGPALAVVDAEPQEAAPANKKEGATESKEEGMEGIRVTIRLAALDEQGAELASPNEQVTYLHVVRFGAKPTAAEGEEPAEDTRPWVVKVVKREATIGPHTFQLHEIYGLTSSSTHTYAPTSALPATPHTYPPDSSAPAAQPAAAPEEDEPQSECLLCLSEPREVVLLPCRHLVACKDCAVNMVEFGAGGNITQPVEPVPAADTAAADGDANAQGEGGSAPATTTPAAVTPTTNPRRKRKAKGWFCPVCRQPYTSLLRITTAPPPPPASKAEGRSSDEEEGAAQSAAGTSPAAVSEGGNGLLGGMLRPGFLRGLSFRAGAAPADVESTAGLGRQGA